MRFARKTLCVAVLLSVCVLALRSEPNRAHARATPTRILASPDAPANADSTPPLLRRPQPDDPANSGFQVLSDIHGIDFRFYLLTLKKRVHENWVSRMPYSARAPQSKSGRVVLRFLILPDGNVRGLRIEESSGDQSLDRAACDAIRSSSPFEALPKKFNGNL